MYMHLMDWKMKCINEDLVFFLLLLQFFFFYVASMNLSLKTPFIPHLTVS